MAYLIIKNIAECDWSFRIDRTRQVVGRSQTAHIVIPSRFAGVSRRHAEIWRDSGGISIQDLRSKCGTSINGVWLDPELTARVLPGDTIWMGGVELYVAKAISSPARRVAVDDVSTRELDIVSAARQLMHQLSQAEIDVLLCLSRGYQQDAEIGRLLHRSPHTIRTEIGNIFRKLSLHSRAELICWLKRASHGIQ